MTIKPGIYRHYKGQEYQVYGVVRHSETEEWLVVYRCLYGDFSWWSRPLDMFSEQVEVAGESVARFEFISPAAGLAQMVEAST
ncbi:DUF1653 domain-containing protein [Simiduia aestuariiviva]|uniref:DUF1653 domain-containing protein n=1 Tax=Simiduia aestuariiviva TaxID=1510459 RepID=A0A839UQN2_9GAMM|nr:DUF1653 domain-containing protein [Simiduia aestuariiviva]MBB3168810.1 hypothetical protein [Simiduia aestuariiviva]